MRDKWLNMLNIGDFDISFFWDYFISKPNHIDISSSVFERVFISWFYENKSIVIDNLNKEFSINKVFNKKNELIKYF